MLQVGRQPKACSELLQPLNSAMRGGSKRWYESEGDGIISNFARVAKLGKGAMRWRQRYRRRLTSAVGAPLDHVSWAGPEVMEGLAPGVQQGCFGGHDWRRSVKEEQSRSSFDTELH